MNIYLVTFCAMDSEAEANPFWHTFLLLSRFDQKTQKLEVVDTWGFYGLPTTAKDSWTRRLKIKIGLDVDFTDNHGMLRHEETRFLDLGCGLHGATFEVSEAKFLELQAKCQKMASEQDEAIKDFVQPLKLLPKLGSQKTRIYPYEHLSNYIYGIEKIKAQQEERPSRLKPFELKISMTLWGPSVNHSNGCKSQAIKLLVGILSKKQIDRLTENGKHVCVPRWSGKMEKIFLHSSGPLREHKKKSGEIVHFRDGHDKDVKLHWTMPPQEIETISGATRDLFKLDDDHSYAVKKIVRQLQKLEWLFRNAILPSEFFPLRDKLINTFKEHYEGFAILEPKKPKSNISSLKGFFMSLIDYPRDEDEGILMDKIDQAKQFINDLYMAVIDDWELEKDDDSLEALAAYLPINKKKELCSIVGRAFDEPWEKREERSLAV